MIITDLPRIVNIKMKYSNKRGLRFNLYQRLYSNFNKYVYITQEINKFTSQSQKDYVVIDGFINTPSNKPLSIDIGKKTILYAGTLDLIYGISNIIEVAKLLHDENIEFLIFGYTKAEELISEMNNLSNLKFHGFSELTELKSYYENTDAFIIPRPLDLANNNYSNPSKLYEYLSYNKPIIINDLPSIPEDIKSILLINKNKEKPVIGFYEIIKNLLAGNVNQKDSSDVIYKRTPSNQIKRYLDLF
jgi:glycosyltransferase involved in cell wall biosynthesis